MLRKRHLLFTALSFFILFSTCYHFPDLHISLRAPTSLVPANATLGFGTILAVSHSGSPRRASLLWAANLTDIDIVIPEQPEWTEDDLHNFRSNESSIISRGSALAWLGHLNALKWFLTTPHTTALILEDDTDFSLHIRQTQIPLLAASTRLLLNNSPSFTPKHYWPPPNTWDIFYPGHCDDLPSPATYLAHPHMAYTDPSVPPHKVLHPDTQKFLSSLHVPPHTRVVHRAFWPFCTFAYAVTRDAAARIVDEFGREKSGGIAAYDVQLLEACRDGAWRCWSVAPEVFHHVVGGSEIAAADGGGLRGREGVKVRVPERGTWNLECGARNRGVWVDEGGPREEVRRLVREMVRRGECPVDGLEWEKTWRGCEWEECGAQS